MPLSLLSILGSAQDPFSSMRTIYSTCRSRVFVPAGGVCDEKAKVARMSNGKRKTFSADLTWSEFGNEENAFALSSLVWHGHSELVSFCPELRSALQIETEDSVVVAVFPYCKNSISQVSLK